MTGSRISFPQNITGSIDCPCIDVESFFSNKTLYESKSSNGKDLVISSLGNYLPVDYGGSYCASHDLEVDPLCNNNNKAPDYCENEWCYVDKEQCMQSSEFLYKSNNFPELYYSYSTCDSTAENWLISLSTSLIRNEDVLVTIPAILKPAHFKNDMSGNGTEYSDDSIPWKGWIIDYLDAVYDVANTDGAKGIGSFKYVTVSTGRSKSNKSQWEASIEDVGAGLSDMSASTFWVSTPRLQITPFSVPLYVDKFYLWIPNPEDSTDNGILHNFRKVMSPFDDSLWLLLIFSMLLVAFIRLFMAVRGRSSLFDSEKSRHFSLRKMMIKKAPIAVVTTVTDFLTANVSDPGGSAESILMFGYAFLILIVVSAYTANLTAFLTISAQKDFIGTMEEAIDNKILICGHPTLKNDLKNVWPGANFVFPNETKHIQKAMLDLYENKKCAAIALSENDVLDVLERTCDLHLVVTKSLVIAESVSFPVRQDLVGGISYWIEKAKDKGVTVEQFKNKYYPPHYCAKQLISSNGGLGELEPLQMADLALPFCVLWFCCVLSIFLHFRDKKRALLKEDSKKENVIEDFYDADTPFDNVGEESELDLKFMLKKMIDNQNYQQSIMQAIIENEEGKKLHEKEKKFERKSIEIRH